MSEQHIKAEALAHGLTESEYELVLQRLGRVPTMPEIGVLSAMWSEHCSYKSSRVHLKTLPTEGPQVVQGPGENAGVVDLGGELVAVFKMESHNHPSYIEPYQGAATGVGGILRDVFTMGARPVANLNSLRFGAMTHSKTPHLFNGVVGGIAGYGNCVGVPTVGGEVYFDSSYNGNILVNVFTVGVAKRDEIFKGIASGVGNPVFYVGAKTGRDGIHGATMASEQFGEDSQEKRPTVQVGDPFGEKLLIEACLELMRTGAIVGIQDMGAAGLTSSSVEMADRGQCGLRLDIDRIPKREEGMNAYECLLSESQERMLVVLEQGRADDVAEIFEKWDLAWAHIGEVIEQQVFEVIEHGEVVCHLPVDLLTSDAPVYDRPQKCPRYLLDLQPVAFGPPDDLAEVALKLLGSPNLCSRRPIFEQFDHMVGVGTVVVPGAADAAVIRVPGTNQAMAIKVDCNSRYCYLDAKQGAALAVAECARNISCTGALPLGTTDCLNFGDPTNPEIMWQFAQAIEGMGEACRVLDTPVVGGNVSLYNASFDVDIYPTPTVAMVGRFEGAVEDHCTAGFKQAGDVVMLLGETRPDDLGGSEYASWVHGQLGQVPPTLDLEAERRVQVLVRQLIAERVIDQAHDCAEGGVLTALLESCLIGSLGFEAVAGLIPAGVRPDHWLWSESPSRIIVSGAPEARQRVLDMAHQLDVPVQVIGVVKMSQVLFWPDIAMHIDLDEAHRVHAQGLASLMS